MVAAEELAGQIGQTTEACEALGVARSTLYRRRQVTPEPKRRPRPHRALDETEREEVLGALHCERFVDKAPAQVWATLLDEGTYLCSIRTMYRILEEHGEVRERRNQRRHPNYTKPELLAEAPNQVWSWDITKLRGPVKWTYYYLYVILDIFSRYVVGWMLAHRESAALAQRLIAESCRKQDIEPDQLTLHADRGSSMRSKPVALLLADLGVTKTHASSQSSRESDLQVEATAAGERHSGLRFRGGGGRRCVRAGVILQTLRLERQSLLRVPVQDDEVLSSVSEPFWFRRRRPAVLRRFLRLLQLRAPALRNRLHDAGRRSLWSRRTAHHRSAPDPSRSSSDSSRTLRSRNATTSRFASSGLDQPADGENDAPECRTSHSRGGVYTWGTPFFCSTKRDLDRCRCGPHRRHEPPDANRGSLN